MRKIRWAPDGPLVKSISRSLTDLNLLRKGKNRIFSRFEPRFRMAPICVLSIRVHLSILLLICTFKGSVIAFCTLEKLQ